MRIQLDSNLVSRHLNLLGTSLVVVLLSHLFPSPALAQEAAASSSVVEAARNSRDLRNNTKNPHKIITDEDLTPRPSAPPPPGNTISYTAELPPSPSSCESKPQVMRLQSEIQTAQADLDALRQQASLPFTVISDHDLDPQYFKPGASGLNIGSAPLLDNQPPVSARVSAAQVTERIANLEQLLRIACEPTATAKLQIQLDRAQQDLDLAARALALNQADLYARPDFAGDSAGQLRLKSEQQEVQDLQAQVDLLKAEIAAQTPQ